MQINYANKYLKYKNKYLNLLNHKGGNNQNITVTPEMLSTD